MSSTSIAIAPARMLLAVAWAGVASDVVLPGSATARAAAPPTPSDRPAAPMAGTPAAVKPADKPAPKPAPPALDETDPANWVKADPKADARAQASARNHLQRARELFAERRLVEALRAVNLSLADVRGDTGALMLRARIHQARGDEAMALADAAVVLKADPRDVEALLMRAVHRFESSATRGAGPVVCRGDALPFIQAVLDVEPRNLDALLMRAAVHRYMGRIDEARRDELAALAAWPDPRPLRVAEIRRTYVMNATDDAIVRRCAEALADAVVVAPAQIDDTQFLRVLERRDLARSGRRGDIDRDVRADPLDMTARFRRALFAVDNGDYDGALDDLSLVLALRPLHLDARRLRLRVLTEAFRQEAPAGEAGVLAFLSGTALLPVEGGDMPLPGPRCEAVGAGEIRALTEAAHGDPKNADRWVARAEVWLAAGDVPAACRDLERAMAAKPDHEPARALLVRVCRTVLGRELHKRY